MPKKSQNQLVLDHLIDHGYITEVIARSYGVRRLASRISDLKTIAHTEVSREMRKDDLGTPYAYYFLTPAVREGERMLRERGYGWNCAKGVIATAA